MTNLINFPVLLSKNSSTEIEKEIEVCENRVELDVSNYEIVTIKLEV